jgi:hypothetical protein
MRTAGLRELPREVAENCNLPIEKATRVRVEFDMRRALFEGGKQIPDVARAVGAYLQEEVLLCFICEDKNIAVIAAADSMCAR